LALERRTSLNTLIVALLMAVSSCDTLMLEERIDLYDPVSMAYQGQERTWFDVRGRRLRLEIEDAAGDPTLLFVIMHDEFGRESEAVYFEGDSTDADREVFSYSADGSLKTTTYYYDPGDPSDRTETELDEFGREVRKRYFRADGTQYGEEDVLRFPSGAEAGWDFRRTGRPGGASFRYEYRGHDEPRDWALRVRLRDGNPERVEVRTVVRASNDSPELASVPFAWGAVSTDASEASPSFSADGQVMVFARYGPEWTEKSAFLARLTLSGWVEEPLLSLGTVYNLAISPDACTIVFSRRNDDETELFRTVVSDTGWSSPESLTASFGFAATYPFLTEKGDLVCFDSKGAEGSGIYIARSLERGFEPFEPLFVPETGIAFDAFLDPDRETMLVTRCFDDLCESGGENGIWEIGASGSGQRQLSGLPYVWGVQPVPALGLLVFTDGEDIRAVPLRALQSR
jgi:hypothetical protein